MEHADSLSDEDVRCREWAEKICRELAYCVNLESMVAGYVKSARRESAPDDDATHDCAACDEHEDEKDALMKDMSELRDALNALQVAYDALVETRNRSAGG